MKKSKREHQLWTSWNKLKDSPVNVEMLQMAKDMGIEKSIHRFLTQPIAGRWYYTYSNEKGMVVGLAKLQNVMHPFGTKAKWMWETCTANDGLELCRFSSQKEAEKAIYKFLS